MPKSVESESAEYNTVELDSSRVSTNRGHPREFKGVCLSVAQRKYESSPVRRRNSGECDESGRGSSFGGSVAVPKSVESESAEYNTVELDSARVSTMRCHPPEFKGVCLSGAQRKYESSPVRRRNSGECDESGR